MSKPKPVDRPVEAVDEMAAFKHDPAVREAMAVDRPTTLAVVEQSNYAVANADLRQPAMDTEE